MGKIRILLDRSRRLVPFWQDQIALALALRQKLGPNALEIGIVPRRGPEEIPVESGLLLVVGDLGLFGEPALAKAWEEVGLRLAREGVQLRALLPCPRNRWLPPLTKLWRAIEWENPFFEAKPEPLAEEKELNRRRDQLLQLLLPAIRVEPGLLRGVRQLLGPDADAGTEVDVWKEFPNPSPVAATPPEDLAGRISSVELVGSLRRRAFEQIQCWHNELPPLVLAEEIFSSQGAETAEISERERAREVLRAAMARVREQGAEGAPLLAQWFQDFSQRLPGEVADRELAQELIATWRVLYSQDVSLPLPNWASPALLAALEPPGELRHFEIWQRGSEIVLSPKGQFPGGSMLGQIRSSSKHFHVQKISVVGAEAFHFELGAGGTSFMLEGFPNTLRLVSNLEAVELEAEPRPDWASAAGRDRYGLWADLEVGGVTQRMRYIRPGRFLMGSPDTEQGRRDSEGPQHLVTLTEGYWLADTPCTQAFWHRVMGTNPSQFMSSRRPVEQVSWDDVQGFLQRLNEIADFSGARLPTEAQWEFACRAGTTTSTYAGELEILGMNKGPLLDEIAWYGGNSGEDFELEEDAANSGWAEKQDSQIIGTRTVASKRCNPWGLYDTLGNVWEWCCDYWSQYKVEECRDPEGTEMDWFRVIRGGSWNRNVRFVRAASRYAQAPGFSFENLGFRFSLAQQRSGRGRGAQ